MRTPVVLASTLLFVASGCGRIGYVPLRGDGSMSVDASQDSGLTRDAADAASLDAGLDADGSTDSGPSSEGGPDADTGTDGGWDEGMPGDAAMDADAWADAGTTTDAALDGGPTTDGGVPSLELALPVHGSRLRSFRGVPSLDIPLQLNSGRYPSVRVELDDQCGATRPEDCTLPSPDFTVDLNDWDGTLRIVSTSVFPTSLRRVFVRVTACKDLARTECAPPQVRYVETFIPAGDFNADGYEELVVGSDGAFHVAWGDATGIDTTLGTAFLGGTSVPSLALPGDLDGDGYPDLLAVVPGAGAYISYGVGNGLSTPVPVDTFGLVPTTAGAVGDLDADGYADFAFGEPGRVAVFRGSASRSFAAPVFVSAPRNGATSGFGASLDGGDLDGDGRSDLVVGAPGDGVSVSGYVSVYDGATFSSTSTPRTIIDDPSTTPVGKFGFVVGVGDLDNQASDGRADLLITSPYGVVVQRLYVGPFGSAVPASLDFTDSRTPAPESGYAVDTRCTLDTDLNGDWVVGVPLGYISDARRPGGELTVRFGIAGFSVEGASGDRLGTSVSCFSPSGASTDLMAAGAPGSGQVLVYFSGTINARLSAPVGVTGFGNTLAK